CAEVPHRTFARLVMPLLRLGRVDEAMEHHKKGYRMVSNNRKFLGHLALHLNFLTLTDNLPRAVKVLQKHLPWTQEVQELSRRFSFYLAALLLLQQVQARGKSTLPLRLPSSFPDYPESGKYHFHALTGWPEPGRADRAS